MITTLLAPARKRNTVPTIEVITRAEKERRRVYSGQLMNNDRHCSLSCLVRRGWLLSYTYVYTGSEGCNTSDGTDVQPHDIISPKSLRNNERVDDSIMWLQRDAWEMTPRKEDIR
ncbi:unnamed protein product [Trichogramma brassicae]|uniref:Uncharacterized protein n=1 Tax=Trichogramma brassicae TaxID=86971 RepID=A0A6H5IVX3_9HYME|nr:unnamed protein product [Trichogramma brassicae]